MELSIEFFRAQQTHHLFWLKNYKNPTKKAIQCFSPINHPSSLLWAQFNDFLNTFRDSNI